MTPVAIRLSRTNKVGHRIAIFPGISTMHKEKKLGNKSNTIRELKFTCYVGSKTISLALPIGQGFLRNEVGGAKHGA